jgi:hypothetical protein
MLDLIHAEVLGLGVVKIWFQLKILVAEASYLLPPWGIHARPNVNQPIGDVESMFNHGSFKLA